jgi:hypothetical protein
MGVDLFGDTNAGRKHHTGEKAKKKEIKITVKWKHRGPPRVSNLRV